MPVNTRTSFLISSTITVFLFGLMCYFKDWFVGTQLRTLGAGCLCNLFFVMLLTAIGNFETCLFGDQYQMRYLEVILCGWFTIMISTHIHRVCAVLCIFLSGLAVYYINNYSQRVYAPQVQRVVPTVRATVTKKKRNNQS